MARDRLSTLDNTLISSHILSKLSLREAIRCSLLSRRWRWLWTLLPILKFSDDCFTEETIVNILFFHSAELESLKILGFYSDKMLWKWINSASLKRVKQISLKVKNLPTSLFYCDCTTSLKLSCLKYTQPLKFTPLPPHFSGFKYLITCSLIGVSTNDDILEQLVAKCPLIESLRIEYCTGLRDLKMCAVNLRFLGFEGNYTAESVTVDSPKLVDVGVLNCSYRLDMKLNSCAALHFYTNNDFALWCISATDSLRKIKLFGSSMLVISLTALNSFHYLEELIIESMDKVAGSDAANLILRLDNLKKVHVRVSRFNGDEIALLGCLLRSAPSLQTMTLTLPSCPQYIHEQRFLKQLLGLERSSAKASLIITEDHSEYCEGCQRS